MRHTIARNAADGGYTKTFVARNVAEVGRDSTAAIWRATNFGVDTRCIQPLRAILHRVSEPWAIGRIIISFTIARATGDEVGPGTGKDYRDSEKSVKTFKPRKRNYLLCSSTFSGNFPVEQTVKKFSIYPRTGILDQMESTPSRRTRQLYN